MLPNYQLLIELRGLFSLQNTRSRLSVCSLVLLRGFRKPLLSMVASVRLEFSCLDWHLMSLLCFGSNALQTWSAMLVTVYLFMSISLQFVGKDEIMASLSTYKETLLDFHSDAIFATGGRHEIHSTHIWVLCRVWIADVMRRKWTF